VCIITKDAYIFIEKKIFINLYREKYRKEVFTPILFVYFI